MKSNNVEVFISTFIFYCIIFLASNNWNLTGKQIAEMIFLGTLSALFLALTINPMTRFIENLLRKK